jgi:hypothetical protein
LKLLRDGVDTDKGRPDGRPADYYLVGLLIGDFEPEVGVNSGLGDVTLLAAGEYDASSHARARQRSPMPPNDRSWS